MTGSDLDFPNFDPATSYDNPPAGVVRFLELCQQASAFLWVSPAYHGTISGLFKNALDYIDLLRAAEIPFLTRKPVGIISVGSGTMAVVNAANTMVYAAHALRAQPLPLIIPIGLVDSAFSAEGDCCDHLLRQRLLTLGIETANAARAYQRH